MFDVLIGSSLPKKGVWRRKRYHYSLQQYLMKSRSLPGVLALGVFALVLPVSAHAATAAVVSSPFVYSFNSSGTLFEAGTDAVSTSPYWWVNSGGLLTFDGSVGATVEGNLATTSPWRVLYAANNPLDTDNGYHPQNIFRLVSRSNWGNAAQQAYFRIDADELSKSPNRNASNGLLLFNRYQSSQTLYYTGIRVDGAAVIKKKINGTYYTMAYKQIFPGTYDASKSPNLLPHHTWVGIRSDVVNAVDGSVVIRLYTDVGNTGVWTLALTATDDGTSYGGAPIRAAGMGGIRTDFMDVSFDNYRMTAL